MIKYFKIVFIVAFFSLTMSCSKDFEYKSEYKSEGELIGEKISEIVKLKQITLASTYSSKSEWPYNKHYDEIREEFMIEGTVITVGESNYNLNNIIKFEVVDSVLHLQFEDI